jgi:hypothetical protein
VRHRVCAPLNLLPQNNQAGLLATDAMQVELWMCIFALSIWGRLELLLIFHVLVDLIGDDGPNDFGFVADSPLERPCRVIT